MNDESTSSSIINRNNETFKSDLITNKTNLYNELLKLNKNLFIFKCASCGEKTHNASVCDACVQKHLNEVMEDLKRDES